LKKLVGRKEVEDAVLRLDMLTKEESLMVMARNLEVAQRVDGVVHVIDENVKATKMLTEDIDDNVKTTKVLTEDIGDNLKATEVLVKDIDDNVKEIQGVARNVESGTQLLPSVFAHSLTFYIVST
jgi:methyl-accepting chemotaxis protein